MSTPHLRQLLIGLWSVADLSSSAKQVGAILIAHMGDDLNNAFPSVSRIAAMGGLRRDTVVRATKELVDHPGGFIARAGGGGASHVYRLVDPGYLVDKIPDLTARLKAERTGPERATGTELATGTERATGTGTERATVSSSFNEVPPTGGQEAEVKDLLGEPIGPDPVHVNGKAIHVHYVDGTEQTVPKSLAIRIGAEMGLKPGEAIDTAVQALEGFVADGFKPERLSAILPNAMRRVKASRGHVRAAADADRRAGVDPRAGWKL